MPMYDPNTDVVERNATPVPAVTNPAATTPVYASRDVPGPKLITDIEGEPWVCDYYGQLLSDGEAPRILDAGLDPTVQQYKHIAQMRISVTGDLTSSTDASTGITIVTGEANIYPNTIIPNVGDMFVGRIDLGMSAIFTVTEIERVSFFKLSAYRITYRLFSDYEPIVIEDLTNKTVSDRFFDNKRLITGQNPIVIYDVVNREEIYNSTISRFMSRLYNTFYDDVTKTFVYIDGPVENTLVYDPFAVHFFNTVLGRVCRGTLPMPIAYEYGDSKPINTRPTLWRMILKCEPHGMEYIYPRYFKREYPSSIGKSGKYYSAAFLDVNYVLIPPKWDTSDLDLSIDAYVLSHSFYTQDTVNMSTLEKAVTSIIKGEPVTNAIVDVLIDETDSAIGKDLFYRLLLVTAILRIKLQEV